MKSLLEDFNLKQKANECLQTKCKPLLAEAGAAAELKKEALSDLGESPPSIKDIAEAEKFVSKYMTSMDEVITISAISECQTNCKRPFTLA